VPLGPPRTRAGAGRVQQPRGGRSATSTTVPASARRRRRRGRAGRPRRLVDGTRSALVRVVPRRGRVHRPHADRLRRGGLPPAEVLQVQPQVEQEQLPAFLRASYWSSHSPPSPNAGWWTRRTTQEPPSLASTSHSWAARRRPRRRRRPPGCGGSQAATGRRTASPGLAEGGRRRAPPARSLDAVRHVPRRRYPDRWRLAAHTSCGVPWDLGLLKVDARGGVSDRLSPLCQKKGKRGWTTWWCPDPGGVADARRGTRRCVRPPGANSSVVPGGQGDVTASVNSAVNSARSADRGEADLRRRGLRVASGRPAASARRGQQADLCPKGARHGDQVPGWPGPVGAVPDRRRCGPGPSGDTTLATAPSPAALRSVRPRRGAASTNSTSPCFLEGCAGW